MCCRILFDCSQSHRFILSLEMDQVKSSKTPTHVSIPSAVFRPLGKWCVSKGDLDKIRFEWNIQQFALLTADQTYKSTAFRGKEGPTKLRLDLCVYRNNLVRVKLYGVASEKCRIKIAILNKKREDVKQLEKNRRTKSKSIWC